jgi:hypothetical protein
MARVTSAISCFKSFSAPSNSVAVEKHQDAGTISADTVYNVVNNTVVSTQTVAVTGIDWHVS